MYMTSQLQGTTIRDDASMRSTPLKICEPEKEPFQLDSQCLSVPELLENEFSKW